MGVLLTPITVRHPTSLEALRGRPIAVDGNLELYQFLSIMRTRDGQPLQDSTGRITSHLNGLAFRTTRLLADYDIQAALALRYHTGAPFPRAAMAVSATGFKGAEGPVYQLRGRRLVLVSP